MGASRFKSRYWFPIIVGVLFVAVLGGVWAYPGDRLPTGDRRIYSVIAGVACFLMIAVWFWLASGAAWQQRLATFLLVVAAVLAVFATIRRVNFAGDMTPEIIWRWEKPLGAEAEAQQAVLKKKAEGLPPIDLAAAGMNWMEYRGPARDGVVPGPELADDWTTNAPTLVWEHPIGGGYGAFVVAGNALITIEQRRDDEAIVCYDRDTGIERWTYTYPEHFSEAVGGEGPRTTPTVWEGKVYALGASGHLTCLDAVTGEKIWADHVLERSGVKNVQWGMSGSPLVFDGMVVVNCGAQKGDDASRGVLAYDANTGEVLWQAGTSQGSYASPMLATLGGKQQILIFDAAGIASHDPADGTELWRFPWTSDFDINAVQPIVVDDNRVFITSNSGGALLQIEQADDKWDVEELWRNRQLKCHFSCPILYEGHVYGLDNGILTCIDVETGKRQWKGGRYGHGQMLLRDNLLLVLAETGHLVLVEATPEEHRELGKIEPFPAQKTWNNPVLVDDLAYIRNDLNMACYRLPTKEAGGNSEAAEAEAEPSPAIDEAADNGAKEPAATE